VQAVSVIEEILDEVYRDRVRRIIDVAIENYMGGQKAEFILKRLHEGFKKLSEMHSLLSKEIKKLNEQSGR